jgi:hypothetical protein
MTICFWPATATTGAQGLAAIAVTAEERRCKPPAVSTSATGMAGFSGRTPAAGAVTASDTAFFFGALDPEFSRLPPFDPLFQMASLASAIRSWFGGM